MSQEEKKGCLVISLSKNDKVVINDSIEIEIKGRHNRENVSAKLVIKAPLAAKIKKTKKEKLA